MDSILILFFFAAAAAAALDVHHENSLICFAEKFIES